jgi:4-amino-4-deoxychorismate lyase
MCRLFESIKIVDGMAYNLPSHEARYNAACRELFGCVGADLHGAITVPDHARQGIYKCRILYSGSGIESVEYIPYQMRYVKSLKIIHEDSIEYSHKYCDRGVLDRLCARRDGCDDILIVRRGLLTDTSFGNIVFNDGARWITPATPLLPGTRRMKLLEEGLIFESDIRPSDLPGFLIAAVINAMIELGEMSIEMRNIV